LNQLSAVEMSGLHPWNESGEIDAPGLEKWIRARLAWQSRQIDTLLAVSGPKTLENTLRPYDDAVATLSAAGSLASLLDSVHPDKAVRDKARELTQTVAEAATALSLNQEVYQALAALAVGSADPAVTHYVDQTLLNYRLAGVDKDEATRARVRELSDKATEISLIFAKNVQENTNRVQLEDASELDGLPEDYIRNHPPDAQGLITLTTDYPDMQPVMTFAHSADLRLRMFRAYNTRAYPANRQLLLDLLAVRQQIASILGFASWADMATANQMMGSAVNMKKFIGDLELASRSGAEREYEMVLAFARQQQPGLKT
jgi:thimet oligopeptidase